MAKSLGFIMMLDVSGSMYNAIDMVKIDSKAFVGEARVGDQFGVNAFSDNAWWVYPAGTNPNISGISADLHESKAASLEIEKLQCHNLTNIGDAIRLGNSMIEKAGTDLKAFVLFSDGWHNTGSRPETVLQSEPPIYVAGLGYNQEYNFDLLTVKNSKSKYYNSPTAYDMMKIFNQIKADSTNSNLALNDLSEYKAGSNFMIKTFQVSSQQSDVQLSVVWSNSNYHFTPDTRFQNSINIVLYDPDDRKVEVQPDINEGGYCIFNLGTLKPGTWKVLFQYSINQIIKGTTGSIDFNVSVHTQIHTPLMLDSNGSLNLSLSSLYHNNPVEGLQVKAVLDRPLVSSEDVMNRYEAELHSLDCDAQADNMLKDTDKLELLRQKKLADTGNDIFPRAKMEKELRFTQDGTYEMVEDSLDSLVPGIYNFDIVIEGKNPETGFDYRDLKKHSLIVK